MTSLRWLLPLTLLAPGCAAPSPPEPSTAAAEPEPAAPRQDAAGDSRRHASHHHDGHEHPGHDPGHDGAPREAAPGHGGRGYHMDFSHAERFAKHFDDPARDAWQKPEEVIRLLEVRQGQTVADLGAGTGYFVPLLAEAVGPGGRVLALDAEAGMIAHLERRAKESGWTNVEARQVPEDDPGLEPRSADRILIVNTWHHIDDRSRYAAKLAQALRPDGQLLVIDFTVDSDFGPPPHHRLPAERVVRELEAGGLRAQPVEESLPKQYAVRAVRP